MNTANYVATKDYIPKIGERRTPLRFPMRVINQFTAPENIDYLVKNITSRFSLPPAARTGARTDADKLGNTIKSSMVNFITSIGPAADNLYDDPLARRGPASNRDTWRLDTYNRYEKVEGVDHWSEVQRINGEFYKYFTDTYRGRQQAGRALIPQQNAEGSQNVSAPVVRDALASSIKKNVRFIEDTRNMGANTGGIAGGTLGATTSILTNMEDYAGIGNQQSSYYDEGEEEADEPYHMRAFYSGSLRPPGLEHFNDGLLYEIKEYRDMVKKEGRNCLNVETVSELGQINGLEGCTASCDSDCKVPKWAFDSFVGVDTGKAGPRDTWGTPADGGNRFMRYETMPFWQNVNRRGQERDIGETLGLGMHDVESQISTWNPKLLDRAINF